MSAAAVVPFERPGWIRTFTGKKFWPLEPNACDVSLVDIAHALSLICRYTGHVKQFYSVAEHCVRVSWACDPDDALWGLLHDAAEAYVCDLARPVKHQPELEAYRRAENAVQLAITTFFAMDPIEPPSVKAADRLLLGTELRDLMNGGDWRGFEVLPGVITPWAPADAERAFLARFAELTA